ncbi:MAG TPA: hypothetical protein VK582_17670 [Pyrinomonadaceae bacterium]|nr:hypothetical protein [Pyrinomonadaceae bacterium]
MARQEAVRSLPKQIICVSCGARKATWKKSEQICRGCDDRRRHGAKTCITDGCDKLINYKATQLCSRHHHHRLAPIILKGYLDNYCSPYPQNERYMTELSSMIDWAAKTYCKREISKETVRRFRGIGTLLQTYELSETLTWEAIDKSVTAFDEEGRPDDHQVDPVKFDGFGASSCEMRGVARLEYLFERARVAVCFRIGASAFS